MDPVNRQTAHERPDLLEWKKCQGRAGWYGLLSMILGGSVTYAGASLIRPVLKKYIPLISLATGAGCGWLVSVKVMKSYRRAWEAGNLNIGNQDGATPPQETKFGDKDFVKE